MTTKFLLALSVGLVVAASTAVAFQEQQQPAAGTGAPAADLQGAASPGKANGTEVNIPGLGNLGVLPKMDFGLELLYGANESKPVEADPQTPGSVPPQEDLTIRGTMKHNF
jgi:hypothetical protein